MYNLDWKTLEHEIIKETVTATIKHEIINLPDDLYTCPVCKGTGKTRNGNLFDKCVCCKGAQVILPCKTSG